jgi:bleomycin hydrolase
MLLLLVLAKMKMIKKWYHLKNSWGSWANNNGYLCMSENYFKLKTVVLKVNKAALPQSLRKKLKLE